MQKLRLYITLAIICIFFSSCHQWVSYSAKVQESYAITENDLQGIQFYLSHPITLYKASSDGDARTEDGRLKVLSDRQMERIHLKAGTKGVYVSGTKFQMAVSFEIGEGRYLIFGSNNMDGAFRLQAKEWLNKQGVLEYDGAEYIAEEGAGKAYLLIKMKKLREVQHQHRIVRGRSI